MLVDVTVGEWNFGPPFDKQYTSSDLARALSQEWGLFDGKMYDFRRKSSNLMR
jgi:hypothetical protein